MKHMNLQVTICSLLIGIVASLFGSCTGQNKTNVADGADTIYTEAGAMSIHRTEPERALTMIDSALLIGNITSQRAEYLKAVTQYGGMHNAPLARQICLDQLERDDKSMQAGKFDHSDSVTLERIYLLLTSIEYTSANHPAIIRYATEASRLAHALEMPDEVGKMEGFIAHSMARTGRTDEGIERLQNTIAELRKIDTFKGVVSYHDASKKLLHILIENERFDDMEPVCRSVLSRLDELGSHPEHFGEMLEGFNPTEYVDFARGQILAFLTTAYARLATANTDKPALRKQYLQKAQETEAEVFRTEWSQSIDCDKMMSAAYHHMGQFDRFEKAMQRFENTYPDTINPNYLICLQQRSEACRMQGKSAEALRYLERASLIRDSLENRTQRDQLAELATIYHLQEEQLARQEKEAEAERSHIINIALAIGLVAALCFLAWFFHQKRIVEKKNRVLAREITEAIKYKEMAEEKEENKQAEITSSPIPINDKPGGESSDAELFQYLRDVILGEKLYLDPSLDRQTLVDRFGLTKERIGAAFAQGSTFKSLIEFLNDCRLPHAAKLLAECPDLSIAEVAQASGFPSADTFGRNFKQKYALTPSQFRNNNV